LKTQIWGHVEEEVRRQIEATSGSARAQWPAARGQCGHVRESIQSCVGSKCRV